MTSVRTAVSTRGLQTDAAPTASAPGMTPLPPLHVPVDASDAHLHDVVHHDAAGDDDDDDDDTLRAANDGDRRCMTLLWGVGVRFRSYIQHELQILVLAVFVVVLGAIVSGVCPSRCSVLGVHAAVWSRVIAYTLAMSVPGRLADALLFTSLHSLGQFVTAAVLNQYFFYLGALEGTVSRLWWISISWDYADANVVASDPHFVGDLYLSLLLCTLLLLGRNILLRMLLRNVLVGSFEQPINDVIFQQLVLLSLGRVRKDPELDASGALVLQRDMAYREMARMFSFPDFRFKMDFISKLRFRMYNKAATLVPLAKREAVMPFARVVYKRLARIPASALPDIDLHKGDEIKVALQGTAQGDASAVSATPEVGMGAVGAETAARATSNRTGRASSVRSVAWPPAAVASTPADWETDDSPVMEAEGEKNLRAGSLLVTAKDALSNAAAAVVDGVAGAARALGGGSTAAAAVAARNKRLLAKPGGDDSIASRPSRVGDPPDAPALARVPSSGAAAPLAAADGPPRGRGATLGRATRAITASTFTPPNGSPPFTSLPAPSQLAVRGISAGTASPRVGNGTPTAPRTAYDVAGAVHVRHSESRHTGGFARLDALEEDDVSPPSPPARPAAPAVDVPVTARRCTSVPRPRTASTFFSAADLVQVTVAPPAAPPAHVLLPHRSRSDIPSAGHKHEPVHDSRVRATTSAAARLDAGDLSRATLQRRPSDPEMRAVQRAAFLAHIMQPRGGSAVSSAAASTVKALSAARPWSQANLVAMFGLAPRAVDVHPAGAVREPGSAEPGHLMTVGRQMQRVLQDALRHGLYDGLDQPDAGNNAEAQDAAALAAKEKAHYGPLSIRHIAAALDVNLVDVEKAFNLFDTNADGVVEMPEFLAAVETLYDEWRNLRAALTGRASTQNALDMILNVAFAVAAMTTVLLVFEIPVIQVFVPLGTVLVSASFAIGAALSNIVSSLIFVLVTRPYAVGDRVTASGVLNGDETLMVKQIDVLTTTFVRVINKAIIVPNHQLLSMNIENFKRSPPATLRVELCVSLLTTATQLERLRKHINAYLVTQRAAWKPTCMVRISGLRDQSIIMTLWMQSHYLWQDVPRLFKAIFEFYVYLFEAMRQCEISFRAPDQSIKVEGTLNTRMMAADAAAAAFAGHASGTLPAGPGAPPAALQQPVSATGSQQFMWMQIPVTQPPLAREAFLPLQPVKQAAC